MSIDIELWQAMLAAFGPALVALITGLNTSGKVKATLAIIFIVAIGSADVLITGELQGNLFDNILILAIAWQSVYALFWKGLGIAGWLQASFPVKIWEQPE